MSNSLLFNQIKLAFPPISANEFAKLRKNKDFKQTLEYSHLYIICQRKNLYFKNFKYDEKKIGVSFQIYNPNKKIPLELECFLPFFQEKLAKNKSGDVGLAFEIAEEEKTLHQLIPELQPYPVFTI